MPVPGYDPPVRFRAIFTLIAGRATPAAGRSFDERMSAGIDIVMDDVKTANWHIHQVLYGLIKAMMEEALGGPLAEPPEITNMQNAPAPVDHWAPALGHYGGHEDPNTFRQAPPIDADQLCAFGLGDVPYPILLRGKSPCSAVALAEAMPRFQG